MAENIDESAMRKFVHRVFRKSDDIGNLTVKSVRQQFLEQLGLEKLDPEQKEVFKNIVHDIYTLYSNKHQEQNGHQGSNVEDSQTTTETDDVSDTTVSSSSVSSRRKKRKRELNSDNDSCVGEISHDLSNKSEKEEQKLDKEGVQKKKNFISKTKPSQEIHEKEEQNDSNNEEEEQRENGASPRSQKINEDEESDDRNSEEESPRKNNVAKKKTPQKIDEDTDSSDSNSDEGAPRKKNASRKKRKSHEIIDEESGDSNSEEEAPKKQNASRNKRISHEIDDEESGDSNSEKEAQRKKSASKKKRSHEINEHALSSDSNSEDQINEEQEQRVGKSKPNHDNRDVDEDETKKKKHKKKSKDNSSAEKKKKSSPPSADSIRLKNLKRFVRTCGLHKNYVKLFAECDSMSQKEKTLERVLRRDTGFEGRITLVMCKKFKQAKEEADEIAELDCSNIITADDGRRPTRRTRGGSDNQPTPFTVSNLDGPKLFSRLKGVVDSDGSDSEEEQRRGKRALNASPEKRDINVNSRKRRRLDSSSDDDDD
ncbi:hypothetical protein ACROYT_G019354 [Oculina patagonica]